MAFAMKFFLVLVALVCCMQMVEMARMRRDDAAADKPIVDLNSIKEQIEKFLHDDNVKALLSNLQAGAQEGLSKIKDGLETVSKTLETKTE